MELQVTNIIRHKDFKRHNMDNDIALLLLAEPLMFNEQTAPICMPLHSTPPSWQECWVAGWGITNSGMWLSSWKLLGQELQDLGEW